jgi:hypothetical protein
MKNKITQVLKSRLFEYILLTIIILLGFFVRLYKINSPIADWHSWRQADTASVSRIYAEKGINLLLPRYYDISSIQSGIPNPTGFRMVEFPFYNAITALAVNAFPKFSLEVWSRLITITTALITSFFLYLIGRKLMGKWGGLLCAFFYLFIPFNIFFTRVILPDPLGVCFGVISLWAFFEFTYNDKKILLFVSSIFFSMALLIKPYLGFYIFPIIYLALKKYGIKKFLIDKKVIINSILFCILAFVPFILWRIWEGQFPEGIPFYEWAFNGNLIRFKPSFWYWIFGERLGHLILGSLGLIPFVFGVINSKIKNLFVHAFLAGALFYVVVVASANVMHDYYQILTIPVISMTLAAGTVYLWTTQIYNRILTRTITIISIGVMLITGWNQISGNYAINHPEIIEAGAEVDKIIPKDAIVIAPYGGDTAFLYQTKRFGWPVIDDSVDNIIKKGADYYVTVDLGSADTKMIEARFKTIEKTDKYIIVDLHQAIK